MKIQTSELIGPALDWAVRRCNPLFNILTPPYFLSAHQEGVYNYSTDWSLTGPIIEREEIELHVLPSGLDIAAHPTFTPGDVWEANLWPANLDIIQICGPTPLIAAMRCLVAKKLGDCIEIPDELCKA